MFRPRSERSEHSGDEMEAGEMDFTRLQNQFREKKGNRKAVSEETQNTLRKQRAIISQLEGEAVEMQKDLKLAGSKKNCLRDERELRTMVLVQTRQDELTESLREQTALRDQLSTEIREMEKALREQQKQMGGIHTSQASHVAMQKHIRVMEGKLGNMMTKFNALLTSNGHLRETIDHLRKERKVFDKLRHRLEKELDQTKHALGQLIDTSTQAYEARDEAQAKIIILQEKAEKEVAQYNTEIKELRRAIDHDQKLKEFMGVKEHERAEGEGGHGDRPHKRADGKSSKTHEALESVEEMFEQMKESTGIQDTDKLVERFIEVEDQNFALFNYVNELNNNIEQLQDEIAEIRQKMENFKKEGIVLEEQRQEIMYGLEGELHDVEGKQTEHQQRYSKSRQMLDQLKMGVSSLFNKIDCDSSAITELLAGHLGVTDSSVLQYLGIIEQRTNELLQMQTFINTKEVEAVGGQADMLLSQIKPAESAVFAVAAPTTVDDLSAASSESDEDRPLNQDELRFKVMKGLLRKEKKIDSTGATGTTGAATSGSGVTLEAVDGSRLNTASSRKKPLKI